VRSMGDSESDSGGLWGVVGGVIGLRAILRECVFGGSWAMVYMGVVVVLSGGFGVLSVGNVVVDG
jgi:hypothetical protein